MKDAVLRTFLRAYRAERLAGCSDEEYTLPAESYQPNDWVKLPHFVTEEFMQQLRARVNARFDEWASRLV